MVNILAKYGFEDIMARYNIGKWVPLKSTEKNKTSDKILSCSVYERIRMAVEELGPAYVKLGQLFSDRDDVLPIAMTDELKKLQSDVAQEPLDVHEKITNELGIDPDDYFHIIENVPFASASISQVFKAQLLNGEWVILKIKRNGIEEIIAADLLIMKDLARMLGSHNDEIKKIGLLNMVETFEQSINRELSFLQEIDNVERFTRNFRGNEDIYVHKTYRVLSNNNILCLEYIEGIKVTDVGHLLQAGFDPKMVARVGYDLYMQQVLEHGYFHADPHPGNILVTYSGQISFIDFGIMGTMSPPDKELIEDFTQYLVQKNASALITTIKKMALEHSIENDRQLERDIHDMFGLIDQSSLKSLDIASITKKLKVIFRKNGMEFPQHVYLLIKGIVLIEGIGRKLDPDLNILELMRPYASQIVQKRISPKYRILKGLKNFRNITETWTEMPGEIMDLIQKIKKNALIINHQVDGLLEIKTSLDRLVLALIISALSIGSSILVLADMPPKVYGVPLLGFVGFLISFVLGVGIVISMIRNRNH